LLREQVCHEAKGWNAADVSILPATLGVSE